MAATIDDEAVLGLGSDLLGQVSPAEQELLVFMGPQLLGAQSQSADGALGFGETDIAWLTAVIPVATVVVEVLLAGAKDAASDLVKDGILATVRSLRVARSGQPAPDGTGTPTMGSVPDGLATIAQQRAYEHSIALGLDESRARTLASAVAGSLRTAGETKP